MIYFIRSGQYVKIGYCARDPIRRLERLQVGNPAKLRLIGVAEGEMTDEREWHLRFDHLRRRGEWFKLESSLSEAIKPHAVSHTKWSRRRPRRKIDGFPAHLFNERMDAMV